MPKTGKMSSSTNFKTDYYVITDTLFWAIFKSMFEDIRKQIFQTPSFDLI